MKFHLKNLGAIDNATVEIAPLTIICGLNNTGKTYVTYAIYALLSTWRELMQWRSDKSVLDELFSNGAVSVDLERQFVNQWDDILRQANDKWRQFLPRALGAPADRFKDTVVEFDICLDERWKAVPFKREFRSPEGTIVFSADKAEGSSVIEFAALRAEQRFTPTNYALEDYVVRTMLEAVLEEYIPPIFMVSTERTGAVIFKEELNLTKNKIVNLLSTLDATKPDINPVHLFDAIYKGGYPLPVEDNVQFVNRLGSIENQPGALFAKYPELAQDFESIAGGRYETNKEGVTQFVPRGTHAKLRLSEASSATRSLVVVWYWLKSQAAPGSMLMIDEPELNLHPENQRAMARFLAKLVNHDVRIFITTHSDTMLREFNTLVMMTNPLEHVAKVKQQYSYSEKERLNVDQVALYVANGRPRTATGRTRRNAISTLERMPADPKLGLSAEIFDNTIMEMGKIQDALRYGAL